ncbi:MAG: RDD family protein [Acidimicrobiales bacterium]
MPYCQVCGVEQTGGANFCSSCGTRRADAVSCASCGALSVPGQTFCGSCGTLSPRAGDAGAARVTSRRGASGRASVVAGEYIAGFWWRVLSFVIDSFIVNVLIGLLQSGATTIPTWALALESVALNAAYFGLWLRYRGWSPGMAMCHMRCTSVDGLPITSKQIFTRTLFYCVWILLPFLHPLRFYINSSTHHVTIPTQGLYIFLLLQIPHYVELLWALWDRRHQTLHDKAAGTIVVRERRL